MEKFYCLFGKGLVVLYWYFEIVVVVKYKSGRKRYWNCLRITINNQ